MKEIRIMVSWNNLDTLASFKELADVKPACLTEVMVTAVQTV